MEIKKGSFVYKVAYGNTKKYKIPNQTNLCRLFWRFIGMFFVVWPILGLLYGILVTVLSVAGFLVAHRLTLFKGDSHTDNLFIPIKHWPQMREHRVYPIVVLLIAGVAKSLIFWYQAIGYASWVALIAVAKFFVSNIVLSIIGSIIAVMLAIFLVHSFLKTETGRLFKSYVAAKKQKVCPLINIVEYDTAES